MPKLGLGLSLPQTRVTSSTPAPVSGMSLWLKADTGVTLSGSNVTAWADQSGNGRNGTADNGYPTFVSSAINGKPAIEFNGTDARITGSEPTTSLPATVIIVAKPLADTEIGVMYQQYGEGDNMTFYRWSGNDSLRIFNETDLTSTSTTGLDFAIFGAVINGVNSEIYLNGSLDVSGNSGDLTPSGNYYLAHWVSGNTYTNMQIAEVIVYNQVLTTPERQQVEAYLMDKYAIAPAPAPSGIPVASTSQITVTSTNSFIGSAPFNKIEATLFESSLDGAAYLEYDGGDWTFYYEGSQIAFAANPAGYIPTSGYSIIDGGGSITVAAA